MGSSCTSSSTFGLNSFYETKFDGNDYNDNSFFLTSKNNLHKSKVGRGGKNYENKISNNNLKPTYTAINYQNTRTNCCNIDISKSSKCFQMTENNVLISRVLTNFFYPSISSKIVPPCSLTPSSYANLNCQDSSFVSPFHSLSFDLLSSYPLDAVKITDDRCQRPLRIKFNGEHDNLTNTISLSGINNRRYEESVIMNTVAPHHDIHKKGLNYRRWRSYSDQKPNYKEFFLKSSNFENNLKDGNNDQRNHLSHSGDVTNQKYDDCYSSVQSFKESLHEYIEAIRDIKKRHRELEEMSLDAVNDYYNCHKRIEKIKKSLNLHLPINYKAFENEKVNEIVDTNIRALQDIKGATLQKSNKIAALKKKFSAIEKLSPLALLIDKYNLEIYGSTIKCLLPEGWLNDQIINFYFEMLQEKCDKALVKDTEGATSGFFFNTFFFHVLCGADNKSVTYDYKSVARWTKRKCVDIFSRSLLFVPIHYNKAHWTLGVIDMRSGRKSIKYYDSLNGKNKKFFITMRKYLADEHLNKKKTVLSNIEEWEFPRNFTSEYNVPRQTNGYDCGVFMCQIARYIIEGKEITFTQDDVMEMRADMIFEVITGEIK